MRVLLVQAVSTHDCGEVVFPIGLARLAAVFNNRHEVQGLDLNLDPFPWSGLAQAIETFKPEVVGISFRNLDPLAGNLVSFVPHLKTLAILARKYAPEAAILLGGSAFTLYAKRLMHEVAEVDLAIAGEAEAVLPMLLENLDAPWTIPNVFWRTPGREVKSNPGIACCQNLDSLPFPDWRLFDPSRYQGQNRYVAFIGVEAKRGCPNSCRYCLYPMLQGHRLRLRNPSRVADELEVLASEYGICSIHFTDAVVNQPAEHLRAICREIIRRRLKTSWTGFFREDSLTAKDLALYRESGLTTIYFSADGASDRALKLLDKNLNLEQILTAARLAAESDILTVYHFLVNLPGEDERSVDQTRQLLEKLFALHAPKGNLGAIVFNNLRLYLGTPLTEEILNSRLIDPGLDLLYPTYFNPPPWDHLRYELNALCLSQSAVSFLKKVDNPTNEMTDAHHII